MKYGRKLSLMLPSWPGLKYDDRANTHVTGSLIFNVLTASSLDRSKVAGGEGVGEGRGRAIHELLQFFNGHFQHVYFSLIKPLMDLNNSWRLLEILLRNLPVKLPGPLITRGLDKNYTNPILNP